MAREAIAAAVGGARPEHEHPLHRLPWELAEILTASLGADASALICLREGQRSPVAWAGVRGETPGRLLAITEDHPKDTPIFLCGALDQRLDPPLESAAGARLCFGACHEVRSLTGALYGWSLALFRQARPWTDHDTNLMAMLSRQVAGHVELLVSQRQLERQLSELRIYQTYFERGPDLMMRLGPDLGARYVSAGWTETLGLPRALFLSEDGRGAVPRIHPDDVERVERTLIDFVASGEITTAIEYRMRHADGRWRWLSGNVVLVQGEILATARDITAQKRDAAMLEALAEAQRRYIQGAEASQVLGEVLEQIQRVTESPMGFIGEVKRDDAGAPWLRTYAITNIAWSEPTAALYEANRKGGFEFRNLKTLFGEVMVTGAAVLSNNPAQHPARGGAPPGHPELRCFLGLPIRNQGQLIGMVGLANRDGGYQERDISDVAPLLRLAAVLIQATQTEAERRRSTAALAASEARFRGLFEAAHDGWLIVDEAGIIEQANPSAAAMFGYAAHELTGQNARVLVAPERRHRADASYVLRARQRFAANPGSVESTWGYRKDGTTFPAEFSFSELPVVEARFAVLVRDATERHRVERLKSEFVSMVSHELRTPLTSIRGALGLLAANADLFSSDEREDLIQRATANADRLNHTLSDILDMERVASGAMAFHSRPLSLAEAARESILANAPYASLYDAHLTLLEPAAEGQVMGDPDRVAQVLNNLLSNACKHSPPGAPVEISVTAQDGWLRVSVRDHGPGVPADFRGRIFQPFSQADSSNTRARGGTGLGLSITRAIVHKLGGQIFFDDAPGGGAIFWFQLQLIPGRKPVG